MAEIGAVYLLEIEAGHGDLPVMPLFAATVVNPTSIGRRGMWRIDAKGVLDVHAYFYFNGRTLSLQSADEQRPIRANGRPVGREWTKVNAPCTIVFGEARVLFRDAIVRNDDEGDDDVDTMFVDKKAMPRPSRPFEPGAFARGGDVEVTRVGPVEHASGPPPHDASHDLAGALGTPPPARPRAAMGSQPSELNMPPKLLDGAPPSMPTIPPPAPLPGQGPGDVMQQVQQRWTQLSLPGKIVAIMSPLVLVLLCVFFFHGNAPSAAAVDTRLPAPSASSAAPANPYAMTTPPVGLPVTNTPNAAPRGSGQASVKSVERVAVDLVTLGQFDRAARLYDQLAASNPNNPAFREAARILRAKLDGGS